MELILNLTQDLARSNSDENRIKAFRNVDFIQIEQILTEQGICYLSNSFLTPNLSAKYSNLEKNIFYVNIIVIDFYLFRFLITGTHPVPLQSSEYLQVLQSIFFDGDKSYSFTGFHDNISVSFL